MGDRADARDVDLSVLSAGYRYRRPSAVAVGRAVLAADDAGVGPGTVAVDVGGGRGDHAAVFAARGAGSVVVDPSPEMAAAAASQSGVAVLRGRSDAIPLRDGVARLVFAHLSIHYGDWRAAVSEAWRVTETGGRLWVWTLDPERFEESFLTRWFPSVAVVDRQRFPGIEALAAGIQRAGWSGVTRIEAPEQVVRTAGEWRAAVESGFVSTLHLLAADEIAAGLTRFDEAFPDPSAEVRYDLAFVALSARKASLA